jgi:hypothetical protein
MRSTLTVLTPADSINLVSLQTVKTVLGIRGRSSDDKLNLFIKWASADCSRYCGRTLMAETVSETFEAEWCDLRSWNSRIVLSRKPVLEIASVTEGDTALVVDTDYVRDDRNAMLTRGTAASPSHWSASKLVVVYTGGFADGEVDPAVESACMEVVMRYYHQASRDPQLRSVDIPDVGSRTWADAPTDTMAALSPAVRNALNPYRKVA